MGALFRVGAVVANELGVDTTAGPVVVIGTVVGAIMVSNNGIAVGPSFAGFGAMGDETGTARFAHSAGITEHWTYTAPGHSPSATASLDHVKELSGGKFAGHDGGIISDRDASYSERLNSELVSTAPYFAANMSNWGNGS